MAEFLSQHSQLTNTLANVGMLFVRVFSLQIFITNYRRTVRPVAGRTYTCPVTDPDAEREWGGPSDLNPLDPARTVERRAG